MSKWQQAIYDRTAADILARTAKAFFNVADWVRIYGNTEQVNAFVRLMTGLDVALTPLTAPVATSFPDVSEINSLIENIDRLRAAVPLPSGLGLVALKHDYVAGPGAEAPDYEDVNDWERDLLLVRDLLVKAADRLVWCGVGAAGQPRTWQNRFRIWPHYVPAADTPVRRPRTGLAVSGSGYGRQNSFRRY